MSLNPGEIPADDLRVFDTERERLHRQMLSSVSHDLKTPLASIIGALEVFERMKDKLSIDKQATLVNVALQEAYRLDNFITNILDMGRLDNGMVRVNEERCEIGSVISNTLLRMNTRLHGVKVNVANSPHLETVTDPILMGRALSLVLDNAVKYGGLPPVIDIQWGTIDDTLGFIHVHDNGSGIPETRIESIFSKYTRFVQEDQQNAGTGLGLAISRSIMALLGGDITAANTPASGALFTLHFPLS